MKQDTTTIIKISKAELTKILATHFRTRLGLKAIEDEAVSLSFYGDYDRSKGVDEIHIETTHSQEE